MAGGNQRGQEFGGQKGLSWGRLSPSSNALAVRLKGSSGQPGIQAVVLNQDLVTD